MFIPPLDGQTLPDSRQKIEIWEAWNLPTCGCKSMVERLTIMLGVFINLLYTHTMPNNHYCSTYMTGIPPLDGQTLPDQSAENQRFFPELRHETCQQVAVKVCWKDLQSCWECSSTLLYTHTMPNNHYCSTYMMAYPHLMAKHYLISQQKIAIWGMKPAHKWL